MFTQEAKRLVLVANDYKKAGSATPATGQLVGHLSNGKVQDLATNAKGDRVKLLLKTGYTGEGGFPLDLVSEELHDGNIRSLSTKGFEAPYEAAEVISLPVSKSYLAGDEIVIGVRFTGYGSLSMKNPYTKHGAYLVVSSSDTSAIVAAALVSNLNKNLDKDRAPRVTASVGGANVLSDLGARTLSLTVDSTTVTLSSTGATPGSGWVKIEGGLYFITYDATVTATLNRPYAGVTATGKVVVNTTTSDIILVGERQAKINFYNPFIQVDWKTSVTLDGTGFISGTVAHGSSLGLGYGPQVANIETFANTSTQLNQHVNAMRQRDLQLNTNVATEYDIVTVKIATTKTDRGSNVTSVRELDIYVNRLATTNKASDLYTNLKALLS